MAVLLALLTALSYGVGDFSGGMAARRTAALRVTATAHTIGLAGLVVAATAVGAEAVGRADLAWGALGGVAGLAGIVLLYRALADGVMSVVSPVTAVVAAVLPVGIGLATGERPGVLALCGIGFALVAIALVSRSGPLEHVSRRVFLLAIGSGLGFGAFFVVIAQVSDEAGLWPLAAGRVVSAGGATALALVRGVRPLVPAAALPLTLAAGALDVLANVTYLYATQTGLLSVVAVISSLYPAATVLLALGLTHERLGRAQLAGLGAAAAALVLIAV